MKLSEAIILGSVSTKQGFTQESSDPCVIKTALRAIGDRRGMLASNEIYGGLWKNWPWVDVTKAIHPIRGVSGDITAILYSLNDTYHWPRPKIAEWVKTIEPSGASQPIMEEVLHEVV